MRYIKSPIDAEWSQKGKVIKFKANEVLAVDNGIAENILANWDFVEETEAPTKKTSSRRR